jgi:hypothetical protein
MQKKKNMKRRKELLEKGKGLLTILNVRVQLGHSVSDGVIFM